MDHDGIDRLLAAAERLEFPGDLVAAVDGRGAVVAGSPQALELLGGTGGLLLEAVHPDDASALLDHVAAALGGTSAAPVTVRLGSEDGGWRPHELLLAAACDEPGGDDIRLLLARDATAVAREVEARRASEARADTLARNARDVFLVLAPDFAVAEAGPGVSRVLGHAPEEVRGRHVLDLVHPDDLSAALELIEQPGDGAWSEARDLRVSHAAGGWRVLEVRVQNGDATALLVSATDVTELRRLAGLVEAQQRVVDLVAANASLGVVLDAVARLVEEQAEAAHCAIFTVRDDALALAAAPSLPAPFGRAAQRLPGAAAALGSGGHLGALPDELASVAADHGLGFGWGSAAGDGATGTVLGYLALFPGVKRFPTAAEREAMVVAATVTGVALTRAATADAAAAAARVDLLTGLLNRVTFLQQLPRLGRRSGDQMAVVLVDLVGFASLNDEYGYEVGDEVLRTVARRLRDTVRGRDLLARFGADEFVIAGTGRRSQPPAGALSARVSAALAEPVVVAGRSIPLVAAVGVATEALPVGDPVALVGRAEAAARRAEPSGGRAKAAPAAPAGPAAPAAPAAPVGSGRRSRDPRSGAGRVDR